MFFCCGAESTKKRAAALSEWRDAEQCLMPLAFACTGGATYEYTKMSGRADELFTTTGWDGQDCTAVDDIVDVDKEEEDALEDLLAWTKLRSIAASDLGFLGSRNSFPSAHAAPVCEDAGSPLIPNMANLEKLPKNFAGDALVEFGTLWRCHRAPHRTLESDYLMTSRELGSCSHGKVRLATSKHGLKRSVAVKTYRLKGLSATERKRLRSEAHIFLCVDHPHVARLYDVYESDSQINFVMELVDGGSLSDRLAMVQKFSERETAFVMKQILSALCYLHSHAIAHRDVKPENMLYANPGGNHLKLIDFGLSEDVSENWIMADGCGTLSYVAPEVLQRCCTAQSDLWSLGVIAFWLLSGSRPFRGSDAQILAKIKNARYEFSGDCWKNVSALAKEFIQALMEIDPSKRLSARRAMNHRWIVAYTGYSLAKVDVGVTKCLCSWSAAPKVQQICRSILAWRLTDNQQASLRDSFLALDSDQDGTINIDDLREALLRHPETADVEPREVFRSLGKDRIRYADFLAAMIPCYIKLESGLLDDAFARFDSISSTGFSASELQDLLGHVVVEDHRDGQVETNGKITRMELANLMRSLKLSGASALPNCDETPPDAIRLQWHL